jgi:hypothetical protein
MRRMILYMLAVSALALVLPGCSPAKKSYSELRGLMLLENSQIGRNRAYYSKHKAKKISAAHRKVEKNKKKNNTAKAKKH